MTTTAALCATAGPPAWAASDDYYCWAASLGRATAGPPAWAVQHPWPRPGWSPTPQSRQSGHALACTHTHAHTHTVACMHTHAARARARARAHARTHALTHTHTHTHTHTRLTPYTHHVQATTRLQCLRPAGGPGPHTPDPPPLQTHQIFSRYSCHGQAQGMQDRVVHVRGIQQIQQLVAKVNPLDQRVDVRVHVDKAGQQ